MSTSPMSRVPMSSAAPIAAGGLVCMAPPRSVVAGEGAAAAVPRSALVPAATEAVLPRFMRRALFLISLLGLGCSGGLHTSDCRTLAAGAKDAPAAQAGLDAA